MNDFQEKVEQHGIVREEGYLYYLNKDCNICRIQIGPDRDTGAAPELIVETSIVERELDYLYFVDKDGDISRINMLARERNKRKNKIKKLKTSRKG